MHKIFNRIKKAVSLLLLAALAIPSVPAVSTKASDGGAAAPSQVWSLTEQLLASGLADGERLPYVQLGESPGLFGQFSDYRSLLTVHDAAFDPYVKITKAGDSGPNGNILLNLPETYDSGVMVAEYSLFIYEYPNEEDIEALRARNDVGNEEVLNGWRPGFTASLFGVNNVTRFLPWDFGGWGNRVSTVMMRFNEGWTMGFNNADYLPGSDNTFGPGGWYRVVQTVDLDQKLTWADVYAPGATSPTRSTGEFDLHENDKINQFVISPSSAQNSCSVFYVKDLTVSYYGEPGSADPTPTEPPVDPTPTEIPPEPTPTDIPPEPTPTIPPTDPGEPPQAGSWSMTEQLLASGAQSGTRAPFVGVPASGPGQYTAGIYGEMNSWGGVVSYEGMDSNPFMKITKTGHSGENSNLTFNLPQTVDMGLLTIDFSMYINTRATAADLQVLKDNGVVGQDESFYPVAAPSWIDIRLGKD
ncbi:MAG: hypothetical protein FWF03_00905, partial [Defluviitaleaceae bacterium]|nr:hypothetical protein [Defluviitaleaceae bacterium]